MLSRLQWCKACHVRCANRCYEKESPCSRVRTRSVIEPLSRETRASYSMYSRAMSSQQNAADCVKAPVERSRFQLISLHVFTNQNKYKTEGWSRSHLEEISGIPMKGSGLQLSVIGRYRPHILDGSNGIVCLCPYIDECYLPLSYLSDRIIQLQDSGPPHV